MSRIATIMARISLRPQSIGGFGEFGHAAWGEPYRRVWADIDPLLTGFCVELSPKSVAMPTQFRSPFV